jgi:hypothetical protein
VRERVQRHRADLELALQGPPVERLDVQEHVLELEALLVDQVLPHRPEQ